MKISSITVSIVPWERAGTLMQEMQVVVTADGTTHSWFVPFAEDDFESRFDYMIEAARREIIKAVKAKQPQTNEKPA